MIYISRFRKNDLDPSKGKQFEFSKNTIDEVFNIKDEDEVHVEFIYKSLTDDKRFDAQTINVRLKLSPSRGDYKIYQNEDESPSLKDFLLQKLGLTIEQNIQDYFLLKREASKKFVFSYISSDNPLYSFIKEMGVQYVRIDNQQRTPSRTTLNVSRQTILFGTPGSGKSYEVDRKTGGRNVYRTTFHPDSDYASFVGCYKPTMRQSIRPKLSLEKLTEKLKEYQEIRNRDYALHRFVVAYPEVAELTNDERKALLISVGKTESQHIEFYKALACADELSSQFDNSTISYSFIPQVFTEAYVEAWKKLKPEDIAGSELVYLVIEEINRGNCAQIFGDLFQLLDRDSEGYSDYRITADSDLRDYLVKELGEGHRGIEDGKLCLPPNLHILATMNTSDQSLFPMDSAFKRRWDWEYIPISYEEPTSSQFLIKLGEREYRWVDFLQNVNKQIRKVTNSEDKQMGNFFIKGDVSEAEFKSKVMFFLWNEVCRDEYHTQNNFFRCKKGSEEREFSFNDLYGAEGLSLLHRFMDYLGVKTESQDKEVSDEVNTDEQEG